MLHKSQKLTSNTKNNLRIYISSTLNNTILTLTDQNGKVKAWKSAGSAGFKGARRATSYAAQQAGELLAQKTLSLNSRVVTVHLKGFGPGRDASIKGLKIGGLQIVKIEDRTSVPHNGCRPPKKRRF